jgi:hypothetical protein
VGSGEEKRLGVDMQAGTVRVKESRSAAHSSPHAARIYESIILGQHGSDCIHTSRDRFSKAGKTILDPFMRTVHTPPGPAADRPGDEKARDKQWGSAPPPQAQACGASPLTLALSLTRVARTSIRRNET